MTYENFQNLLNEAVDKINQLKKIGFNIGEETIEVLQTISILLNALKRYTIYLDSEKKNDLEYTVELLKTANDSLARAMRLLQKKLR